MKATKSVVLDLEGTISAPKKNNLRRHEWLNSLGGAAKTPSGSVGLILVSFVVLVAIVGPFVAPYNSSMSTVTPFSTPSASHLLGGDVLGRDVLSRVLDGGWVLLIMAALATAFGVIVGSAAGITAAYVSGKIDGFIMRTVDVFLSFPQLVLALLLVSIVGAKLWLIVLAVGLGHAPQVARVMRSAALDVSERDFVKATELQGVSSSRVMIREILPNLTTPLMVEAGLRLTYSIVVIAGLAFLGFGQPPPAASWGIMINENQIGLSSSPWGVIVPAVLIALLTIGTNTYTDAVSRVSLGIEARSTDFVDIEAVSASRSPLQ
jgi:peptide/nickel transport system permease protein